MARLFSPSQRLRTEAAADRCGSEGALASPMPAASLVNAGSAGSRRFSRAQIGLDEGSEEGLLVVVIESDYPIIFSSPLAESLSLCLSSCFSSVSCLRLLSFLRASLFFSSICPPCRSTSTSAPARRFSSCPWPTAAAISLSQTVCWPGTPTAPGTARVGPASALTSTAGETSVHTNHSVHRRVGEADAGLVRYIRNNESFPGS